MQGLLSENVKITKVKDAVADGTTAVESAVLDMAGFDGVFFFTSLGTAAADNSLHVEQGDNSALSDAADLANSEVDVGSSDEDLWVDLLRPQKRYLRAVVLRGTSCTCGDIWALQYRAKDGLPLSNVLAGTINGMALVNPLEAVPVPEEEEPESSSESEEEEPESSSAGEEEEPESESSSAGEEE